MFDLQLVELDKLKRTTNEGKRVYETPEGDLYPSVTTITSQLNKKAISEWRARVGEAQAKQITAQASARGTSVHKLCEKYILGTLEEQEIMPSNVKMFNAMSDHLSKTITKVYSVEGFLYSDYLRTAGQVDLVAEYNGKISIVDFKTSKKQKREEWIRNYFIQESAYAVMWEERTGQPITQLVTVIGTDEPEGSVQVFIKKRDDYIKEFISLRQQYDQEQK
jgi:hypothetical protein